MPIILHGQAQGNGVVIAAPTAEAYVELTNASDKILADLRSALPQARTIILYDAAAFTVVPYYPGTTDLVRTAAATICDAEAMAAPRAVVPTVDIGSAAQGLASLVQVTLPTYSTQGQNLALDNSALVGSFATAASESGYTVVNPAYLLPAISQLDLDCQKAKGSGSLADLWKFVNSEAIAMQKRAESKQPLKDALDALQNLKDILLASSDKGASLLARSLQAESMARAVGQQSQVAVIDMRLDAANIDSTAKTMLWWRKTKFSANIAAHYWIFSATGTNAQFAVTLVHPGYVNILQKDVNLKTFALSQH